ECPAPVAVHPLAERAEFTDGEKAAHQRPERRGPGAQHPVAQRAEGGGGEQHARPGHAEDHPAECHGETLTERVNGTVRRLLEYEERVEELMQWMRRIG